MISFRRTSKTFYYMWLVLLSTQLLKHLVAEQDDRGALIQHKACNLGHRDLMLVSLMNGEVTALNLFDGTVLWQISTGQKLFCSSLSTLEVLYNGIPTRLVPSLDGSLFRFHNEHFEPLPFSAETLLSSSFKLPGDSTMVGSKELRTVGLDPACGQLFYRCDKDGCDRREQNLQEKDVLVIKHMTHTVRAVSARDGAEKWNFSVGHHELGFSEKMDSVYTSDGKEQCDSSFCQTNLPTLKFSISDGMVRRQSFENTLEKLWERKLGAPISKAWVLVDGQLESIDLLNPRHLILEEQISSSEFETLPPPSLYVGVYDKQLYLQPSELLLKNISSLAIKSGGSLFADLPKVQWAPYLASTPSRTPALNYGQTDPTKEPPSSSNAMALFNPKMDYPYDQGFYLSTEIVFVNDTPSAAPDVDVCNNDSESYPDHDWVFEDIQPTIIIVSLQYYWKEVVAISCLSAILLNSVIYFTRAYRRRLRSKLLCLVQEQEVTSDVSDFEEGDKQRKKHLSSKSSDKPDISPIAPPIPQYHSRYQTDFMHIQCLGKGGFGVVFHAKNALDECDYAIKRITLPNSADAKEKVTREVKALAKLDHPNIVRYFQSWFETPPPGWQEDRDRIWESTEKFVPTPMNSGHPLAISRQSSSLTNPPARNNSGTQSFIPKFKFDESKESSLSLGFPVNKMDDSLEIVFSSKTEDVPVEHPFHKYAVAPVDQQNLSDSESSRELERLDDSGYHRNDIGLMVSHGSFEEMTEDKTSYSENEGRVVSSQTSSVKENENHQAKLFLYIQMQLCKRETLRDYLNANTLHRDKNDILLIFRQICDAVEYIHSQGLIHRDLKPTNIFFATDNTIKVGDFGLVTALSVLPDQSFDGAISSPNAVDQLNLTNNVGTKVYMSPEQVAGRQYNSKVDIYALGLLFFELKYPFSTMMERVITLLNVKKNEYPERFIRELPSEYKFINWMLARNPKNRPSITEVLNSEVMLGSDSLLHADRVRTRTVSRSSNHE